MRRHGLGASASPATAPRRAARCEPASRNRNQRGHAFEALDYAIGNDASRGPADDDKRKATFL